MRLVVYICVALWVGVGVVIFLWNLILSSQMLNNRTSTQMPILGPRQFSFQTDPADYTELGQQYRQKSIRAEIVLLAYTPTLVIAIVLASLV